MSQHSCYPRDVPGDIAEVVSTAVRYFRKKRAPADYDELVQEAFRIALSTCSRYPEQSGNPGYIFGAVRKGLGNFISKQLTLLTIKDSFHKAREHQERAPLEAVPEVPVHITPEVLVVEEERYSRILSWRIRFRRNLEAAMRGFSEEQKHIVERLFGFDGLPSEDPQTLAASLGISRREVTYTRRKLIRNVRDDLTLRILRNELDEISADLAEGFEP